MTYEDGQAEREALVAQTEGEAKRPAPAPGSHTLIPRPRNKTDPAPSVQNPSSEVRSGTSVPAVPDDTFNNSNLPNVSLAPTSSSTPNKTQVITDSFY